MSDFDEHYVELDGVWFAKNHMNSEHAERVKNFETTHDDVFIISYPKCGE